MRPGSQGWGWLEGQLCPGAKAPVILKCPGPSSDLSRWDLREGIHKSLQVLQAGRCCHLHAPNEKAEAQEG